MGLGKDWRNASGFWKRLWKPARGMSRRFLPGLPAGGVEEKNPALSIRGPDPGAIARAVGEQS
jgi:hypothetical protein